MNSSLGINAEKAVSAIARAKEWTEHLDLLKHPPIPLTIGIHGVNEREHSAYLFAGGDQLDVLVKYANESLFRIEYVQRLSAQNKKFRDENTGKNYALYNIEKRSSETLLNKLCFVTNRNDFHDIGLLTHYVIFFAEDSQNPGIFSYYHWKPWDVAGIYIPEVSDKQFVHYYEVKRRKGYNLII